MFTETVVVSGMTCQHCVASVTEEIEDLPGVRSVHVDLPTGRMIVTADRPMDPIEVGRAVEAAGFRVLSPATR